MTPDQEKKFNEIHEGVMTLKTSLEGRGGVFDRLEKVESEVETHKTFRVKTLAAMAVAGAFVGAFADQIKSLILGRH